MEIDSIGNDLWKDDGFFPLGNTAGGSFSGKTDSEGNTQASVEGHVTHRDDSGGSVSAKVEGNASRGRDGKVEAEVTARVSYDRDFSLHLKA